MQPAGQVELIGAQCALTPWSLCHCQVAVPRHTPPVLVDRLAEPLDDGLVDGLVEPLDDGLTELEPLVEAEPEDEPADDPDPLPLETELPLLEAPPLLDAEDGLPIEPSLALIEVEPLADALALAEDAVEDWDGLALVDRQRGSRLRQRPTRTSPS